jgi:isoprenylcysteine carboxyl methyltransferase (ICMT) family protein YpbQ
LTSCPIFLILFIKFPRFFEDDISHEYERSYKDFNNTNYSQKNLHQFLWLHKCFLLELTHHNYASDLLIYHHQ